MGNSTIVFVDLAYCRFAVDGIALYIADYFPKYRGIFLMAVFFPLCSFFQLLCLASKQGLLGTFTKIALLLCWFRHFYTYLLWEPAVVNKKRLKGK